MADGGGLNVEIGVTLDRLTKQLAAAESRMIRAAKKSEDAFAASNKRVADSFGLIAGGARKAEASLQGFGKGAFDQLGQSVTTLQQRINSVTGINPAVAQSARDSAAAFEAFDQSRASVDALRASIDPLFAASQRYERALQTLDAAQEQGVISARQYAALNDQLAASYLRAGNVAGTFGGRLGGLGLQSQAARQGLQQIGFQVQDFAVQVGAGTSATQAFAQQFPQLASAFGPAGVAIGTLAAIGIPLLVAAFGNARDGAESFGDQLRRLNEAVAAHRSAVDAAREPLINMAETYGSATDAARELNAALAEVAGFSATAQLSQTIQTLTNDLLALTGANEMGIVEWRFLADELGVAESSAASLSLALGNLARAEGPDAQAQAAADLLSALERAAGGYENMSAEARALYDQTAQVGEAAARLAGSLDEAAGAGDAVRQVARDIASALSSASGADLAAVFTAAFPAASQLLGMARVIVDTLAKASARAGALESAENAGLAAQYAQYGAGRSAFESAVRESGTLYTPFEVPAAGGGGGGGGGAAERSAADQIAELLEQGEKEIEQLELKASLLGKTAEQVTYLTAQSELLNAAKEKGLDLDAEVAGTGETLREQIDAQAQSIANLTAAYEMAQEKAEYFKDITEDLKDGLINSIVEGQGFRGVLEDIAKSLAKAALQAALFGTGPLASLFGGNMVGTGLFSFIPGFASGGYTGDGGRNQPKGVVHGGEYVFSKDATRRIGVRNLDAMHRQLRGFSSGGAVGPASSGPGMSPSVQVVVIDNEEKFGSYLAANPRAEREVMNIVKRNGG